MKKFKKKYQKNDPLWSDTRWPELREEVFKRDGKVCGKCGMRRGLQIDHIFPKSKYPALTFEAANLQVLCDACNAEKGTDTKDYRKNEELRWRLLRLVAGKRPTRHFFMRSKSEREKDVLHGPVIVVYGTNV